VRASESIVVNAPVERIIEFVTDPVRYPKADTKILKLTMLEQRGNEARVRARGYLRSRLLQGALTLRIKVQGQERIDIDTEPGSISFPTRLALEDFVGEFTFQATPKGVRVTHTEDQRFRNTPLGRLADRISGRWLREHLANEEMPRLKAIVESAG